MRRGRHRKHEGLTDAEREAHNEAAQKSAEANRSLRKAKMMNEEIVSLSSALQNIRKKNHFGEMIRSALGGG